MLPLSKFVFPIKKSKFKAEVGVSVYFCYILNKLSYLLISNFKLIILCNKILSLKKKKYINK